MTMTHAQKDILPETRGQKDEEIQELLGGDTTGAPQ